MNEILLCAHDKIKELNKKLKGFIEEEKRIRVDNDIEMKDEGNNSLFKTITSKVQIRKHFDLISYDISNK